MQRRRYSGHAHGNAGNPTNRGGTPSSISNPTTYRNNRSHSAVTHGGPNGDSYTEPDPRLAWGVTGPTHRPMAACLQRV